MRLKDLKEKFLVNNFFKNKGQYLLSEKQVATTGRSPHKFICKIHKKGQNSFFVEGFKATTKLSVLEQQVSEYVKSLPYDSDYYNPRYRDGLTEELIIHDYLNSLGFTTPHFCGDNEYYQLINKDIYGLKASPTGISIWGMDAWNFYEDGNFNLPEEVTIALHGQGMSWVTVKAKSEVESMKKAIDSLLKPLLVGNSVRDFKKSEEFKNASGEIEVYLHSLAKYMEHVSIDYKSTLKERLLEMAAAL